MSAESSSPTPPDQPTGSFRRRPGFPVDPQPAAPADEAAAATQLVCILDKYLEDLKAGRAPSRAQLVGQYPQFATQLEACMAGLEFLHAAESPHPDRLQTLGDFRIIREVGRGGMGAVFEADQMSLGRRVALKILRFGAVSDPEAIERFRREAETVAKLHHTNIVPIFAVGSERGVNYYAMQFIEGQSLAEVFAKRGGSLPPERVADWGLQAAEALTHAHQRGVIHRDVKPSNLILDNEQRLWLTDFGLARRMDDVTLSLTGALLGTPRYMSPEQATAAHKHVDHRSDLFSLGATLYELLAGKPAFAGQTPHEVIQHILECKPTPIRDLAPGVPRDLETIVYKCMAKDRGERYESASELAGDLRAFLDGRPIRARRASRVELAVRWLRHQQRSVKLVAAATAATLLMMMVGFASWKGYDAWQQTSLKLATPTPPLVGEVLGNDDAVLRVETVPTQMPLVLPAGDYRLRVSGEGTLSETFALELRRNQPAAPSLDLRDQNLWASQEIERSFALTDFGDETALMFLNKQGIALSKRSSPVVGWSVELGPKHSPALAKSPGFRWPWNSGTQQYSGYGVHNLRPWISSRAVDLNGDGTGDVVCAARHQAWLMALSGKDGSVLWFVPRAPELLIASQETGHTQQVRSAVLGDPIVNRDCDQDGVPDVIATFVDVDLTQFSQDARVAHRWVEAISGKTGQSLWVYEIPKEHFDLPAGATVPYQMRWFCGSDMSYSSNSGGGGSYGGRHRYRYPSHMERGDAYAYRPDVQLVPRAGAQSLAIVAGQKLVMLDPLVGKADDATAELPARCGRPPQWADVDGDGAAELLLLEEIAPTTNTWPQVSTCRLVVWSPAKQSTLWTRKLDSRWPLQSAWTVDLPTWPLVSDLNGDGKAEIIVPNDRDSFPRTYISNAVIPSGKLVALSGESGAELWTHRLASMDAQVDHFMDGPDIDADGWREVYAVTLALNETKTFVDALSGKSGTALWSQSQALTSRSNSSEDFRLLPVLWWRAGVDGWPQLIAQAVNVSSGGTREKSLVGVFSAGTGEITQLGKDITDLAAADIDHDGLDELIVFNSKSPTACDIGGRLHVIRGLAREPWRILGDVGQPVGDLDGDSIADLVSGISELTARSGHTGQVLWRSPSLGQFEQFKFRPARPAFTAIYQTKASGDLDGDSVDDLLATNFQSSYGRQATPFSAISGRTGKPLWTATDITCTITHTLLAAEAHDLDGDGQLEVVWLAALDYGYPQRNSFSSNDYQLWLFVNSGQTGKLRWAHPLSAAYGQTPGSMPQVQVSGATQSLSVGDVDGDGALDLLVPMLNASGKQIETCVLGGKDGKVLWRRPFVHNPYQSLTLESWIPPTVCDLDGDGKAEVVFNELTAKDATGQAQRAVASIAALHGKGGGELWTWKSDVAAGSWSTAGGKPHGDVLRPVALRTAGKDRRVAALLPGNERHLVILNADGVPQVRKLGGMSQLSTMSAIDVGRGGVDSLVLMDSKGVLAVSAHDPQQTLWTRPLGSNGQSRILAVTAANKEQRSVVAVATDPTNNSVLGLDAATGRTVWSCPGPIPRTNDGTYLAPAQIALLDDGRAEAPYVFYSYGGVARCRQAVLTDDSTPQSEPRSPRLIASLSGRGVSIVSPRRSHAVRDERWLRDLPWIYPYESWPTRLTFISTGLFFSTALIVIPAAYLWRLVLYRRFTLKTMLMLPAVAGLFLTAGFASLPLGENIHADLLQRMGVAVGMAPVSVALGLLAWWCWVGQWRRVVMWLGLTLPVSGVAAVVALWTASANEPLSPEEVFDWSGLYQIWFVGAYLTAWLMLIALPIKGLFLAIRRKRRSRSERAQVFNLPAAGVLEATIATDATAEV